MGADIDPAVRFAAARHLPVATYGELRAAGLSPDAIRHRVARGWLHRAHRGVYFVGSPDPPAPAPELAAALAAGPGAVVSHLAAARLLKILPEAAGRIDVTVPGDRHPRHAGVHVHRVPLLHREDVRIRRSVPLTAPARTLIDLGAMLGRDSHEQALDTARRLGLVTPEKIMSALRRVPRRRGARQLRGLVEDRGQRGFTRSPPERRLLRLLRAAGLPTPLPNEQVEGKEVDAVWPELRVTVEMDSAAFHTSPRELDADRARDELLGDAGWRLVRVTARQLRREPERVVARITTELTKAGLSRAAPLA